MKLALVLLACSCTDDGGPRLDSVTPAAAARGASIVLAGERLCLERPCGELGGEVQLGLGATSYRANVVSSSDQRWEFVVPSIVPIGETDVLITVAGRSSNSLAFEVVP